MPKSNQIHWRKHQQKDPFFTKAQSDGYRSRASYKLLEIDKKDNLIQPGMTIIDLGATPGGWSQIAAQKLDGNGAIIALDRLEMTGIAGVEFIHGDFTEDETLQKIESYFTNEQKADLILSDMAPNLSGVKAVDIPKSYYLADLVLDLCTRLLKENGNLLIKVFHGEGFEAYLKALKQHFTKVKTRKPEASQKHSREIYLLGVGFKL